MERFVVVGRVKRTKMVASRGKRGVWKGKRGWRCKEDDHFVFFGGGGVCISVEDLKLIFLCRVWSPSASSPSIVLPKAWRSDCALARLRVCLLLRQLGFWSVLGWWSRPFIWLVGAWGSWIPEHGLQLLGHRSETIEDETMTN